MNPSTPSRLKNITLCLTLLSIVVIHGCSEKEVTPEPTIDIPILLGNTDDLYVPNFSCSPADSGWKFNYLHHILRTKSVLINHRDSLFKVDERYTELTVEQPPHTPEFIETYVFSGLDISNEDYLASYVNSNGIDTLMFFRSNTLEFMVRKDTSYFGPNFAYQTLDKSEGTSSYVWILPSIHSWERTDTATYLYYDLGYDHWAMQIKKDGSGSFNAPEGVSGSWGADGFVTFD